MYIPPFRFPQFNGQVPGDGPVTQQGPGKRDPVTGFLSPEILGSLDTGVWMVNVHSRGRGVSESIREDILPRDTRNHPNSLCHTQLTIHDRSHSARETLAPHNSGTPPRYTKHQRTYTKFRDGVNGTDRDTTNPFRYRGGSTRLKDVREPSRPSKNLSTDQFRHKLRQGRGNEVYWFKYRNKYFYSANSVFPVLKGSSYFTSFRRKVHYFRLYSLHQKR